MILLDLNFGGDASHREKKIVENQSFATKIPDHTPNYKRLTNYKRGTASKSTWNQEGTECR